MSAPRLLAVLLLAPVAAGCFAPGPDALTPASVTAGTAYPVDAAFDEDGPWSRVLVPGPYGRLDPLELQMPSFDGTRIHMGVFLPDVPEGTKVPVIVDAGPYYGESDAPATSDQTTRLGGFLIENFVPHGYAVAQVSVRGSGLSTGCGDYMGEKEQGDLDAVVTFLGEQEWSSGAIALIGRSYDGSTAWQAAMTGNPYLRTIVPISGVIDVQQLHFRNGTAETRSPFLGALYYSFGATAGGGPPDGPEDPRLLLRNACVDGALHAPMGAYGTALGGGRGVPGPGDEYWATREFTQRVLDHYQGSLFYVHGLQDWNVRPSQGAELYNAFEGRKKALLGQWAHNYPDRPDEHDGLRWDWAEMLLRWFDSDLKGVATDTGPTVEIQDHRGRWRAEPENAWPPQDATWIHLHPSQNGALLASGAEGSAAVVAPAALAPGEADAPTAPRLLAFESEPFDTPARISGQPRLHVTVRSSSAGGNIHAELWEHPAQGEPVQIGRAQMDLRYAAGGRTPTAYVPGTDVVAHMEFYPLDAHLDAGSKLILLLTGEKGAPSLGANLYNPTTLDLVFTFGDDKTSLQLPTIERTTPPTRWDVDGVTIKDEFA